MFTSPSFPLSSSGMFQCTEGNQKTSSSETFFGYPTATEIYGATSTRASPLSSATTFGAPSYAGFGSSMNALGFSSVHPFGISPWTSVEGPHATRSTFNLKQSHCCGQERGSRIENYKRTPEINFNETWEYESISAMPVYKDKSHEELRWEDYKFTRKASHLSSGICGCPQVLGQGYPANYGGTSSTMVEGPHATRSTSTLKQSHCGDQERGIRIENYKSTPETSFNETWEYESISAMPVYKDKSHEELRWEDYKFTRKGGFGSSFSANPCSTTATAPLNTFNPFVPKTTLPSIAPHNYVSGSTFNQPTTFFNPCVPSTQNYNAQIATTETMHQEKLADSMYDSEKASHSSSGICGCPQVLGQGYPANYGGTSTWGFAQTPSPLSFGAASCAGYGSSMSPFGFSLSSMVEGPNATRSTSNFKQSHCGGQERGSRIENYKTTPETNFNDTGEYESISAMPVYKDKSHEELRWEDYKFTTNGGFGSSFSANPCSTTATALNTCNPFVPKTTLPSLPTHMPSSSFSSPSFENFTGVIPTTPSSIKASWSFPIGESSTSMVTPPHNSVSGSTFNQQATLFNPCVPSTQNNNGQIATTTPVPPISHLSFGSSPSIQYGISSIPVKEIPVAAFVPREVVVYHAPKAITETMHDEKLSGSMYENEKATANYGGTSTWAYAQTSSPVVEGPHASRSTFNLKQSHCGGQERGSTIENYKRTSEPDIGYPPTTTGEFVSISAMSVYEAKSHEELRWEDYQFTTKGGFGSSFYANPCSTTATANPFVPKTTLPSTAPHNSVSGSTFNQPTTFFNPCVPSPQNHNAQIATKEEPSSAPTPFPPTSHLSLEASQSIQYVISSIHVKDEPSPVRNPSLTTETMHEEKLSGSVYEDEKDDIKAYASSNDPTEEKNLLPTIPDVPSKLQLQDYYTKPQISELESKERTQPGFCSHVKDFVVGRHGYGSIKFLGETDVRNLDLETFVQFNKRGLIVYMDESKKPPVGQGLNKPAEITLLNIKCIDKKSGVRYKEGPNIDKYIEMLKKKVVAQGGEFISYNPVEGEWKFRVQHF